jgi:hypothetical protein
LTPVNERPSCSNSLHAGGAHAAQRPDNCDHVGTQGANRESARDMRSWIADLQAAGELIRIDKLVDPLTEMG